MTYRSTDFYDVFGLFTQQATIPQRGDVVLNK